MMKKSNIPDKWFYIAVICFSAIFLIKIIAFSDIIHYYPMHSAPDMRHQIARLIFIPQYGFHGIVPNFHNPIVLFGFYPPGWNYFTSPIYAITDDARLSAFISLLLMYVLGFFLILLLCTSQKISLTKAVSFYLFLFANPLALDYLSIGRVSELFGFLLIIPLFIAIMWYKDHRMGNLSVAILTLLASSLLLAHPFAFIPGSFLILCLFFSKPLKAKIRVMASILISLIITSFWWIPFLKEAISFECKSGCYSLVNELINMSSVISFSTLALIIFFIVFYFYWISSKKSKKEFTFFLPLLILAFLIATRLIIFIPVFNRVPINPYTMMFFLVSFFFFFKSNVFSRNVKKLIFILLVILPIFSVFISLFYLPSYSFEYNILDREVISSFDYIDGKFAILGEDSSIMAEGLAIYGAIYHNLHTLYPFHEKNSYLAIKIIDGLNKNLKEGNCGKLRNNLERFDVDYAISFDENCNVLKSCSLKEKFRRTRVCLFKTEDLSGVSLVK